MKLFATPSVELNSENNPFLRLRNRPSTRFLYTGDSHDIHPPLPPPQQSESSGSIDPPPPPIRPIGFLTTCLTSISQLSLNISKAFRLQLKTFSLFLELKVSTPLL